MLRIGLVALLLAAPAGAQSLPEALANAYTNNPTLQAARARLRATDENVPQALAGWRPTVILQGSAGYADGTATNTRTGGRTDVERNPAAGSATLSQPLYRGGRTQAAVARSENQVLAERARLLASEQQVLLDSVTAYVNVIRDQQVVRLNQNNVVVLQRQLQATNDRFRVGEITRTDVAQAEARLAGARAELATSQGNLQTSAAVFTRQAAPPIFDITTVAYAIRKDYLFLSATLLEGRVRAAIVPPERAVDIDTELDFKFAEWLLRETEKSR